MNINTISIPIRGRHTARLAFVDSDGAALDIDGLTINVYILDKLDDATSAFLLHKLTGTGVTTLLPTTNGVALLELSDADLTVLSSQRTFPFVATADDGTVRGTLTGYALLTLVTATSEAADSTSTTVQLSTRFVNIVSVTDYVGGTGYLDGIATVGVAAGVWVKFTRAGAQPEEWELVAGTDATDAGVYQRPTDYNASTNAKVWIRRT